MSRPSRQRVSVADQESPEPGATAEGRRAIGAALLAVFVGALDLTVIATILPAIVTDLEINTADIDRYVWIVNGYLLAYVVAIPIVGRVSDRVGRPAAFAASLALFLAGSVWCAVAGDLGSMIAGRTVQGLGGGALLPVTMALVGDLLPPARRLAALGLVGAIDTLGWVLGPLWGAALLSIGPGDEPWRWVFVANLPLGAVAAFALFRSARIGQQAIPAAPSAAWLREVDVGGAVLLSLALVLLNLGLSSGGEIGAQVGGGRALGGTRNPLAGYSLPLVVGAVVVGIAFVWWERRVRVPVLPLGLFRNRRFAAAIAANFVVGASLIVAMVDVPVVVTLLVAPERIAALTALTIAPFTVLMALLSFAGGRVAARLGERATVGIGLLLVAAGYATLWFGLRGLEPAGLLPGLVLAGAGFGLVVAPIGAVVLDAAPAADRGIAAGLTLVFRLLGMTVGISTLTSIGVNRLQALVEGVRLPTQLPGESGAEFLGRQTAFFEETIIPLSLQVVRETFLIAGALALLALVPVAMMRGGRGADESRSIAGSRLRDAAGNAHAAPASPGAKDPGLTPRKPRERG